MNDSPAYGYALIPQIDMIDELKTGKLIDLSPKKTWKMSLYWHYWAVESSIFERFNRTIVDLASKKLG